MPRFPLICAGLFAAALLAPLQAAPADSLLRQDILGLMDKLGMGYSRPELERNMAASVQRALQGADSATRRIALPVVDETVHTAFGQRLEQVRALQSAMAEGLAARFTHEEIQSLRRAVEAEPYQRLLEALQLSSPAVARAERELMDVLNRDVQGMIRLRLAMAAGQQDAAPRP